MRDARNSMKQHEVQNETPANAHTHTSIRQNMMGTHIAGQVYNLYTHMPAQALCVHASLSQGIAIGGQGHVHRYRRAGTGGARVHALY